MRRRLPSGAPQVHLHWFIVPSFEIATGTAALGTSKIGGHVNHEDHLVFGG